MAVYRLLASRSPNARQQSIIYSSFALPSNFEVQSDLNWLIKLIWFPIWFTQSNRKARMSRSTWSATSWPKTAAANRTWSSWSKWTSWSTAVRRSAATSPTRAPLRTCEMWRSTSTVQVSLNYLENHCLGRRPLNYRLVIGHYRISMICNYKLLIMIKREIVCCCEIFWVNLSDESVKFAVWHSNGSDDLLV